ncbi:MAG: hypothetical protein KJ990_08985 [Proteobacteria bacterium]|nr:hypothetical protein [Pseudomonadota bacterium]MBU1650092.1 hypothetical protein [Pseudomonadota bacterium]
MIDFNSYSTLVIQFFSDHISIALALGIAISYFLYKKPEITVKFLALCFFFVAVFYTMSLLSQTSTQEDNLIHKSERAMNDSAR